METLSTSPQSYQERGIDVSFTVISENGPDMNVRSNKFGPHPTIPTENTIEPRNPQNTNNSHNSEIRPKNVGPSSPKSCKGNLSPEFARSHHVRKSQNLRNSCIRPKNFGSQNSENFTCEPKNFRDMDNCQNISNLDIRPKIFGPHTPDYLPKNLSPLSGTHQTRHSQRHRNSEIRPNNSGPQASEFSPENPNCTSRDSKSRERLPNSENSDKRPNRRPHLSTFGSENQFLLSSSPRASSKSETVRSIPIKKFQSSLAQNFGTLKRRGPIMPHHQYIVSHSDLQLVPNHRHSRKNKLVVNHTCKSKKTQNKAPSIKSKSRDATHTFGPGTVEAMIEAFEDNLRTDQAQTLDNWALHKSKFGVPLVGMHNACGLPVIAHWAQNNFNHGPKTGPPKNGHTLKINSKRPKRPAPKPPDTMPKSQRSQKSRTGPKIQGLNFFNDDNNENDVNLNKNNNEKKLKRSTVYAKDDGSSPVDVLTNLCLNPLARNYNSSNMIW